MGGSESNARPSATASRGTSSNVTLRTLGAAAGRCSSARRGTYQRLESSRVNERFSVGYCRRLTAIIMPTTATTMPPSTTQSLQSLTTSVTASASTTANMTTSSACIHTREAQILLLAFESSSILTPRQGARRKR